MGFPSRLPRWLFPVFVVIVSLAAASLVAFLQWQARTHGEATDTVLGMKYSVADMQNAPFNSSPATGGSARAATAQLNHDEAAIAAEIHRLDRLPVDHRLIDRIPALIDAADPSARAIIGLGVTLDGYAQPATNVYEGYLARYMQKMDADITESARSLRGAATAASDEASVGSVATTVALVLVFALLYRRAAAARATAERLWRENSRLLAATADEALHDALTGLPNRRAFERDIAAFEEGGMDSGPEVLTAIFDLDGFKRYNDTFGHAAGDALLIRLARALEERIGTGARVYRIGGDEFCLLARGSRERGAELVKSAAAALHDSGSGWSISCSWGMAWTPSEAASLSVALDLADMRMYARKRARPAMLGEFAAPLVQLINERDDELGLHTHSVMALAEATARRLGMKEPDVAHVRVAAQLHDIGKAAVPDSVLEKPGPLDADEWTLLRQHTTVGERILAAAPALAPAAALVRASHERVDGDGYPDGLVGAAIPLGARIIAACDAYDAMTTDRCYQPAVAADAAIAELERCAGGQFDPAVVSALCAVLAAGAADQRAPDCQLTA